MPQSASLVSQTGGSVDEMEELRIGEATDANIHEKADMIEAHATVSGTAV